MSVSYILAGALIASATLSIVVPNVQAQNAPPRPTPAAMELNGKTVLVTGSTDGLGREVARRAAAAGAHVIVHGRNLVRGQALVLEIEKAGMGSATFYAADFASLDSVRAFGEQILADYDTIDVLVNNAGVWVDAERGRVTSADGHELHFAVNYLAGYLLTRQLLPRLLDRPAARIVNVSSLAQSPIDFDNVMLERNYSDGRGYAQSKLAQILFTRDLADELTNTNVAVYALHPATMMNTPMVLDRGATPRSTVDEGVAAVMQAITAPGFASGTYFNGVTPADPNAQTNQDDARRRLRELSDRLTGAR